MIINKGEDNMNDLIIEKVNEEIRNTKVNLTYKEFIYLANEIKEKDEKINKYKEYILSKERINLLQDEELLKVKNKLPSNVRFIKDGFKISDLEENTWYTSKYKDNEFKYKVIRYKNQEFDKYKNAVDVKYYVDNNRKEYFVIVKDELSEFEKMLNG